MLNIENAEFKQFSHENILKVFNVTINNFRYAVFISSSQKIEFIFHLIDRNRTKEEPFCFHCGEKMKMLCEYLNTDEHKDEIFAFLKSDPNTRIHVLI